MGAVWCGAIAFDIFGLGVAVSTATPQSEISEF